jgi:hypothetical protein
MQSTRSLQFMPRLVSIESRYGESLYPRHKLPHKDVHLAIVIRDNGPMRPLARILIQSKSQ